MGPNSNIVVFRRKNAGMILLMFVTWTYRAAVIPNVAWGMVNSFGLHSFILLMNILGSNVYRKTPCIFTEMHTLGACCSSHKNEDIESTFYTKGRRTLITIPMLISCYEMNTTPRPKGICYSLKMVMLLNFHDMTKLDFSSLTLEGILVCWRKGKL